MKDTAVGQNVRVLAVGPILFDVGGLLDRLLRLADARHDRGKRYELGLVLLLIVLAKLSGQDRPSGIADWIRSREDPLRQVFRLSWSRMPHHNTIRRVTGSAVKPDELDRIVAEVFKDQPKVGKSVLVSIDGKTLHGTIDVDNPHGEHLLAAYLPEEGVVLMQMAVGRRENEIVVAPELLKCIELKGKIVAGDAMHTQRKLSVQILEAGGDYLWLVDDNQPTLKAEIELLFTDEVRTVEGGRAPNDFETARTVDKGHGRLESRQITVSSELKGYARWPGLEQVIKLERRRVDCQTGEEEHEVVYGLTSLSRARAPARELLRLNRTYWGIENGLHQRRDVTFQEDRIKMTRGNAGRVMATINNLVIGLLRVAGVTNVAQARRECDAGLTKTLCLIAASALT